MAKYVNFNDPKISVGKRKVAYVKYATSKGTPLTEAKRQANAKFGMAKMKKDAILVIFDDAWGQCSYVEKQMFQENRVSEHKAKGYNLNCQWKDDSLNNLKFKTEIKEQYKDYDKVLFEIYCH